MNVLEKKDYLEIKVVTLVADYDIKTIINLYQPIIGHTAAMVYLSFLNEAQFNGSSTTLAHETLFNKMQITAGDFVDARKTLEGFGLIKTYLMTTEKNVPNFYTYYLFAPKTPAEFYGDSFLSSLLKKNVGEQRFNQMKLMFKGQNQEDVKGEDISASYYSSRKETKPNPFEDILGRKTGETLSDFSYEKFFDALQLISQIKKESITSADMKEIERLALLNSVNEETAADLVASIYRIDNPQQRIDFELLGQLFRDQVIFGHVTRKKSTKNKNSGDTQLAKKISLMEVESPAKYMVYLNGGVQPSASDLLLIEDLSSRYQLTNASINALIDYVLQVNNNVLSRPYTEKIAASIARQGTKTAVDTMDYLLSIYKRTRQTNKNDVGTTPTKDGDEKVEDWDALLDSLDI